MRTSPLLLCLALVLSPLVACRNKEKAADGKGDSASADGPRASTSQAPAASANTAAGSASAASGRPSPTKVAECTQLNTTINRGVEKMEKLTSAGEATPAMFRSMADTMEQGATDLAKVTITTPELSQRAKEYQVMSKAIAAAARDAASALDGKDPEKMRATQEALEKATAPEDALVDTINKICEAP